MSTPITHTVSHFCEALIYDDSPLLEGDDEGDRKLGRLVRELFEKKCGVVVAAVVADLDDGLVVTESSEAINLLARLSNELSDPYGSEWGDDPRDKKLIANCVRLIRDANKKEGWWNDA